jgi:hypothetical protein
VAGTLKRLGLSRSKDERAMSSCGSHPSGTPNTFRRAFPQI